MPAFTIGLDLGQANDPSALAVVERAMVLPPALSMEFYNRRVAGGSGSVLPEPVEELRVRHLQRFELGTPYPAVVADVARLMRSPLLDGAQLIFDRTGVGVAVGDLFYAAWQRGEAGRRAPWGATITGGDHSNGMSVTKRDLIGAIQVPLQLGRLKVAAGLALGGVLEQELTSFRLKLTASGRDTYDIQRRAEAGHGDTVIAVALAAFYCRWSGSPELYEAGPVS